MDLVPPVFTEDAAKDFLEAFAEVLRHKSVHDGVDAGVSVGHAVRQEPEGVRGLVEWEIAVKIAQDDNMVRQPANAEENGDYNDHFGHFPLGPFGL